MTLYKAHDCSWEHESELASRTHPGGSVAVVIRGLHDLHLKEFYYSNNRQDVLRYILIIAIHSTAL